MKKSLLGLSVMLVSGCGVFAASEDPKTDDAPMPPRPTAMAPVDNAMPPPVGGPAAGIHVSASRGAADGSGTEGRPLKSLNAAFALAKAQGVRVVACAEDFAEAVVVVDGVSAYGYYDCNVTPWKQVADRRATVKSPTSPALLVKNIAMPTRFEGFEFDGPDLSATMATEEAGTSIGLEVRGSKGFTLAQSVVKGGAGAAGKDGVDGPQNSLTPASNGLAATPQNYRTCNPALQNCAALLVPGGLGGATTCAIGPAGGPGGQGGYGQWYYNQTSPSTSTFDWRGRTFTGNAATAKGGINTTPDGMRFGLPGSHGAEGAEGTDGANGAWALTKAGFVRGNGTAGTVGQPGQGGGGGGGTGLWYRDGDFFFPADNPTFWSSASGGGGGAGGCGGQPGVPATGGGANIGALVVGSEIAFDATTIAASAGGRAGLGNLGSLGTAGGAGGAGFNALVGLTVTRVTGRGGDGGSGGNGGAAGHGAPGPSIALVFAGARPSTTPSVKLVPGPAGEGQPMLTHAATVGDVASMKTLPAVKGEAVAEYVIKD